MARSGGKHDEELPEAQVVVLDGAERQQPAVRAPRRSGVARVGMFLAAVALFAFGVLAGHTTLNFEPGQAMRGQEAPVSTTSETTTTSPAPDSSTDTHPSTGESTGVGEPEQSVDVPYTMGEITRSCGRPVYIAQVGYVTPLPAPVDMTLLAGDPPRSVNLKTGTVGPPILEVDDGLFTDRFATDADGTVVVLRSCDDPMQATVVRVSLGGEATPITIPGGWKTFGSLVRIDDEMWLGLSPLDNGRPEAVLATDGSGDIKPMPLVPNIPSDSEAISPDEQRLAHVELNTDGTPGYQILVSDGRTHQTSIVPGIRLGAAHPLLAFSPDSRWLVITIPTLVGEQILLYGPDDLTGPYSIPGTVLHPRPDALPIYPGG